MKRFQRGGVRWRRALGMVVAASLVGTAFYAAARGGGRNAAGLDELGPDLFVPDSTGLPANLQPDFESTAVIAGDGSLGTTSDGRTISFGSTSMSSDGNLVFELKGVRSGGMSQGGRALIPGIDVPLGPDLLPPMLSLKSVPVPPSPGLQNYIRDKAAAIQLGKALFWDAQVGSDGQACASCHFAAGADSRMKNQISPGLKGGDHAFDRMPTGRGGPNYLLKPADFPLFRLADPLDRGSDILFETNDVVSSQGTFSGMFRRLDGRGGEDCDLRPLDEFNVGGVLTRVVEPRNSPTVVNAAFYDRNFWDGRANNTFNGVSPFGARDHDARVLELLPDGTTVWTTVRLENASLASQAVGPALSDFEMSCGAKSFKNLGRKMLQRRPLAGQQVHAQDSVLASLRGAAGDGLKTTYPELIRKAFQPAWWQARGTFGGYSQMENNFSLFWGLAIMVYEQTLVSDEAPFDRFVGSPGVPANVQALSPELIRGLQVFRGKGLCVSCHKGAEFTGAATNLQTSLGESNVVEHMFTGDRQLGLYDSGFYNIGVRPTAEDLGVGATDPWGAPLSLSRGWISWLQGNDQVDDTLWIDPCLFNVQVDVRDCFTPPDPYNTRVSVDGAFKTPTLRNVALTGPYFHNGSRLTLEQVVEFYNRGGDRRGPDEANSSGRVTPEVQDGGATNVHPAIHDLQLTTQEQADLVAFLRHGLTDPRVACERAPFDHPELRLFNGQAGNAVKVTGAPGGKARDDTFLLPAVGAAGRALGNCLRNDDGSLVHGTEPPVVATPTPTPTLPKPKPRI
ncbi:cytochrome-c peroxidase [Leptothrix discophora]|uniref:Cytochrome c peroxidase n=1 Tax=Leptothrix discophora TaxID=89 RepID=A0ABT9G1M8_LEPDI|nr:cytochrome c peroxidase [Leptothrix discophora]MDP4300394.1 cytochrome c peroxidase [Leptothrix discophora]